MVVDASEVDFKYSLCAGLCTWALLAGFIVFPSAYGVIERSKILMESGQVGEYIQSASQRIPYICLASIFCGLATAGLVLLWARWKHNLIWVGHNIFL